MREQQFKIAFLWLLIIVCYILHSVYHLSDLFFGIDISIPNAQEEVPLATHIFHLLVEIPVLIFALLSLYRKGKIFYRISFILSILLCALNFTHCIETLIKEPSEFSQIALLSFIFVVNLILVHQVHRLAIPWKGLPKFLQQVYWAKHQQRWFGKWHLYVGVFAGFILCIVGLTGSILVFQDEIDRALNPDFFTVLEQKNRIPIQDIIPMVQKKYPERVFNYVSVTNDGTLTSTYNFKNLTNGTEFFVNPYTAEICGRRIIKSSFVRIVMDIHMTLLVPQIGKYITGFSALCMLILTISGLRLWVPKKWKQLKSVLTVNFKASFKRQNYDWHNVLGFYSAPVVMVLALTGFVITFSSVFVGVLFILNGKSPDAVQQIFDNKSVYQKDQLVLTSSEMYDIIRLNFEKAKIESITMPKDSVGTYSFMLSEEGTAKTGNKIMVAADQYTGNLIMSSERDFPPTGKSYLNWTIPLHYGTFGGMPTRILALLGGLIPLAMFITGVIIWWPRYKKQKDSTSKRVKLNKKTKQQVEAILKMSASQYFFCFFKKGLRYAGIILASIVVGGMLYGVISGIVFAPAIYVVLYLGIAILINMLIALMVLLFQIIFLLPFKKNYRIVLKYVAYSLAFALIFGIAVYFVNQLGGVFI